jgi:heme oxygenase
MSLRELTKEKHQEAERQEFVNHLLGGDIDPLFYAEFLGNQHPIYDVLENLSMASGVMSNFDPDIRRAPAIWEDFKELWPEDKKLTLRPVVAEYLQHIKNLFQNDPSKLMAHIYVRHMGDLAGGQMIAKKVPGSGKFYKFNDPTKLKEQIRSKITDDLAEEANVCFGYAIRLFKELMEDHE